MAHELSSDGLISGVDQVDSSVTLYQPAAASTVNRVLIYNASEAVLYIRLGGGNAAPSKGSFSVAVAAGGYFETPDFVGTIRGIWASTGSGFANITRLE